MSLLLKMVAGGIENVSNGERITLNVVTADGGAANRSWSEATPTGQLTFTVTNPVALGKVITGREYYVTVSECSPPAPPQPTSGEETPETNPTPEPEA